MKSGYSRVPAVYRRRSFEDFYGGLVLVAVPLSASSADVEGNEFVLTEQRPRMQSRASVAELGEADAVLFAVNSRPVTATRGDYRVALRHGVSTIHTGHRHTPELNFHDAA